jgi:hypothetical protein
VSNRGVKVSIAGAGIEAVERMNGHPGVSAILLDAFRMATRGGRSFYRLPRANGSNCYAVSPASGESGIFGAIVCTKPFSPRNPILDLSVFQRTRDLDHIQLYRAEGIATDGVAKIALHDVRGATLGETDVQDNVYHFDSLPTGRVEALVALDGSGSVVKRLGIQRGG